MSAPASTTVDVATVLGGLLATIPNVRVYTYVADTFRPPGLVIGQPDVDYANQQSGFCMAEWTFPVGMAVSRNQDKAAQAELSRLVAAVAQLLWDAEPPELFSVEPLDARPAAVQAGGTELPGYQMRVRVRA